MTQVVIMNYEMKMLMQMIVLMTAPMAIISALNLIDINLFLAVHFFGFPVNSFSVPYPYCRLT